MSSLSNDAGINAPREVSLSVRPCFLRGSCCPRPTDTFVLKSFSHLPLLTGNCIFSQLSGGQKERFYGDEGQVWLLMMACQTLYGLASILMMK